MQNFIAFRKRKFPPLLLANLAIFVTMLVWGTSFISTKIALAEIPPFTLAFIRFFITSILLFMISKKAEPHTKLTAKSAGKIALAGFVGICVYFCFENTGIAQTTAANASLIVSITPILSIALNMAVFRARLSPLEIIGILIGLLGAYLTITANGHLDFSSKHFQGNLYMLGAIAAWAVYTMQSKQLQTLHTGLFLVTWQTIFATVCLVPFALLEYQEWRAFSLTSFGQLLYLAVACSGIGYFLYVYALKTLDVVLTTLYLNLVPIIGVITGYFILGETILPVQIAGGAIIILAICVANLNNLLKLLQRRGKTPI